MTRFKKVLILILFAFLTCFCRLEAFADIKVNNVNFDNSNSFMFLSASNIVATEVNEISSMTLKKPNRIFFDINNAILTRPNETWHFKNSNITQVKISQFSTNPNVVRVVFYHTSNFDPKTIKVINVKGNYLFKYGPIDVVQSSFVKSYRSARSEETDYLEKTVYIPQSEIEQSQQLNQELTNVTLQNVQKAFSGVNPAVSQQSKSPILNNIPNNFNWNKVFKLRTNFYLSRVDIKNGNILLLGSGRLQIEKPLYLTNPSRVVYDLPNAMVTQRFKNVEIQLSETETLKVGQFEPSKVRLVITTSTPEKYRPIFSSDGQGLLLGNDNRLDGIKLYENTSQILKTTARAENSVTDVFSETYSQPIVYSVKENDKKLVVMVFNAVSFNEEIYKKAIAQTNFKNSIGYEMKGGGVRYEFPLKENSDVEVYSREDGRQLYIRIRNKQIVSTPRPQRYFSQKSGGLIIIDPGHGGIDSGAIKAGISEKDINLEVSKMIYQILNKKGYKVNLTRWDDKTMSLEERVEFSDKNKADIFVSIHVNSSVSSDPNGIETHWWTDDGFRLAEVVHEEFTKNVKAENRGLIKSKFYVINHTKAKSILVEIGFISNDNERSELVTQSRKQKTAEGIADGIMRFMKKEGIK